MRSIDAGWSSSVARRAHNPKVVGSNPAPATKFKGHLNRWPFSLLLFLVHIKTGEILSRELGHRAIGFNLLDCFIQLKPAALQYPDI
jgi:hypothetical protein